MMRPRQINPHHYPGVDFPWLRLINALNHIRRALYYLVLRSQKSNRAFLLSSACLSMPCDDGAFSLRYDRSNASTVK